MSDDPKGPDVVEQLNDLLNDLDRVAEIPLPDLGSDNESDFELVSESDSSSFDEDFEEAEEEPNIGIIMAAAKPTINLDTYSGNPKNTKDKSRPIEPFTSTEWWHRVQSIGGSANWSKAMMLHNALLSLEHDSPAYVWYMLIQETDEESIDTWDKFCTELDKEFAPPDTPISRIDHLNTMKMMNQERIEDYSNKVALSFVKFTNGLKPKFNKPEFTNVGPDLKDHGEKVKRVILDYMKESLFLRGLTDEMLTEITQSGEEDMEKMIMVGKRVQAGKNAKQSKKEAVAAAVGASMSDQYVTKDDLKELIAAVRQGSPGQSASNQNNAPKQDGEKKKRERKKFDLSEAICHYCLEKAGHISPKCPQKDKDRKEGNYRATVRCPRGTKEQWDKLSANEKGKGKWMVPGAGPPPEGVSISGIRSRPQASQQRMTYPGPGWGEDTWSRWYAEN